MKKLTIVVTLFLISLSTFSQSDDIINNIDNIYEYLKSKDGNLKEYVKDFAYCTENKDTLYLQKDCDISLIITKIWKTDESIVGKKPYIVLHPNIASLLLSINKKEKY